MADVSTSRNLFRLALVYTALDDFDKAFEVINQSLDRREGFMFGYGITLCPINSSQIRVGKMLPVE